MKAALAIALCAAMVGCAVAPKSTGVVDVGDESYRVTARGTLGLPADSRKVALMQADEFCAAKGRAMQVTETGKAPLSGPYEVTFKCLSQDQPEGTVDTAKRPPSAVQRIP